MEVEFMTADTTLPPCMPLPRAMLRLPISSTAKVMYARMLDIVFLSGIEDANGILFIHFPIVELAAALARSTMTVKRYSRRDYGPQSPHSPPKWRCRQNGLRPCGARLHPSPDTP